MRGLACQRSAADADRSVSVPESRPDAGQANQLAAVRIAEKTPSPSQVWLKPRLSSSGTIVPEPAMPRPRPRKIAPSAMPLRAFGTCGSTVPVTSTITTPPATPDSSRQPKYQTNDSGVAQAKNAAVMISIISRSVCSLDRRIASSRAMSAPPR